MLLTRITPRLWMTLVVLLIVTLPLIGCQHAPLVVQPAQPLPAPKVTPPKVLTDPVQRPTWLQSVPKT